MQNILVIGGSYFAGRVFVEELVKQDDIRVYVFNRGNRPLDMPAVTELVGDRHDSGQIHAAIPPLDWTAVVDFCAYEPADIDGLLENLPGRIGQYIFISTTTVYDKTSDLPVREDSAKLAGPQLDLAEQANYGFDKWRAEEAVRSICGQRGVRYTIFRPAIIYGYYNYAPRETYFFDLLRNHQPIVIPNNGLALFSVIWVVDMARTLICAIGNCQVFDRAFNLASDELISYQRIIDVLARITGKAIEAMPLSVAEIERRRIPLPFPLDKHLVYCGDAARTLFSLSYTPFTQGLREALKYYLAVKRAEQSPATG